MAKSKHVLHGALTAHREKNDPIIKAANVLESSNSYSRAGRMSESLLTGKDALLMSSNAQKNRQNKDNNKEEENSKSPDMRASWDVTRLRSVHKELSNTALSNSNNTNNNRLQRDDVEKDIENGKNRMNSEGSYSFKTVPRDSSKFRHFLGENIVNYNKLIENEKSGNESNEMEFQNLGPGHYQVRYDIIDHNPHAHTFLPKSSHKRRSKSQQESVNKEVESKEYVPFEKDSRCSKIQDHPKWYDKNRGPTSMFKSTSAIRELPRRTLVDQFYDNDQTKFSHPRPITAANFSKDITRAQASLVGRVGVHSAPDTYYDQCLNLNVTRPTLTKGMTFDQMRVSRDKQRRAGRHNISLIDYDVENNPKVNYPNWGHFYDVDEALLKRNLGDSRHKSIATANHVRMDKQLGRSDVYGSARENSAGLIEQEGSDDMYPATSILSTNQAYDKTHQKLTFFTYFDKMKKRPDYLYRIPDHNNLDYDAELTSVFPRSPNAIIMPEKPPKDTIQDELTTEFYDQKYSIVHERPKAIDFSRNAERNGQMTAKLMRSNVTSLDMFYDVSRGLQYLEPRLQGDPMMKTQKGRVELYQTSKKKKKKKSLAQKKIEEFKKKRRQAVPKEFTDYIDINETMGSVKKKSIRGSYVDYARSVSKDANVFEKNQILRKRVNKAVEPSCVTYTPIYSQVEPKPRNIFLGKPSANIP